MPSEKNSPIPTITEIASLSSDPNMKRVRVNGKSVAVLRNADVESLGLKVGTPWTMGLDREVRAALSANKTRRAAMQLLGRRAYSRGELIERLTRKGHERTAAERIADELEQDRWIDDAAYARHVVDALTRAKPASPDFLSCKLRSRQIDPALADEVARQATAGQSTLRAAMELARRRLPALRHLPAATAQRRLAATLCRRGFDDDLVMQVLDRVLGHDATNSLDQ
jgi:regulatory protein